MMINMKWEEHLKAISDEDIDDWEIALKALTIKGKELGIPLSVIELLKKANTLKQVKGPTGENLIVKDVKRFTERLRQELNAVGLPYYGLAGKRSDPSKERKANVVIKETWQEDDYGTKLELVASVRNPNNTTREYFTITLKEDDTGDFFFYTAYGPNLNLDLNDIINNEAALIIKIGESVERTLEKNKRL